jgi:hypothetical protein
VATEEHARELESLIDNYYVAKKGHYTRSLKEYKADLEAVLKRLDRQREDMNTYCDIRNRIVKTFYISDVNPATLCLIVEGKECGNEETEWNVQKDINMAGCYNILESVYKDAAADYENAYAYSIRRPHDKKAQEKLEFAERFFKDSPLVDWSGTDGENAMATIRARVNRRPSTRRIKTRHKALEHQLAKKQNTERYYDTAFKDSYTHIIKEAFEKTGRSLKDIACEMGVSNGYLSCLKSGSTIPNALTPKLKEFCDIIGCGREIGELYKSRAN